MSSTGDIYFWRSNLAVFRRYLSNAIKPCVCNPFGFPHADVNTIENKSVVTLRPLVYWRLWLFDTALVSAGLLFFLATQYGTYEFFGRACAMALLPLIPVMVLVGGGGSTVFALTKVWIENRGLSLLMALALLVGPALVVTLVLVLLGVFKSPNHRLNYICLGNAPVTASHVQVAGYSTLLHSEWLAVFNAGQKDFQTMVAQAKLVPADNFEIKTRVEHSSLNDSRLFKTLPSSGEFQCFQRVFNEAEEHQRGGIYAVFDPATSTAVVFREYHD
jgi:hypothetical protein